MTGTPQLKMRLSAPAGGTCAGAPCWKATSSGWRYKDRELSPTGLRKVVLKAGIAGKAKISVKGRGVALALPAAAGPGLLAQDTNVRVQLVSSDGECWEATYPTPAGTNTPEQFKDKGN